MALSRAEQILAITNLQVCLGELVDIARNAIKLLSYSVMYTKIPANKACVDSYMLLFDTIFSASFILRFPRLVHIISSTIKILSYSAMYTKVPANKASADSLKQRNYLTPYFTFRDVCSNLRVTSIIHRSTPQVILRDVYPKAKNNRLR